LSPATRIGATRGDRSEVNPRTDQHSDQHRKAYQKADPASAKAAYQHHCRASANGNGRRLHHEQRTQETLRVVQKRLDDLGLSYVPVQSLLQPTPVDHGQAALRRGGNAHRKESDHERDDL
jgi:hypothetical protein